MENNSGENKHNNHRHKRHNRPRNNQKERNQNRQLNEEQENITETQAQDIPTNDQLQSQTEGNAMLEDDDPDDIGNISDIEPKKVVKHVTEDDKDHTQAEDWEKYLDIDIRTGLSPESAKIAENIFLTRGLSDTPEPERTHCRQYQYNACKLPTYDWISKLDISLDYTEGPFQEQP